MAFDSIYRDYSFFPIFLLFGYLGSIVTRWRSIQVLLHTSQGKTANLCVAVGGGGR